MEPKESTALPNVNASSPAPVSGRRPKPLVTMLAEDLATLYPDELSEVQRVIERMKAARGIAPDPDFVAQVLAALIRFAPVYKYGSGVPIPTLRAHFRDVPRPSLDRALLDAEERKLLRLVASELPSPFVDPAAGIRSKRGFLYFIAPAS